MISRPFILTFFLGFFLTAFTAAHAASAGSRVNEIMYDLPGPDKTESGLGREWVEILNDGDTAVTLVGGSGPGSWRFIDSGGPHLLAKTAFRGSMTIAPGEYVILAADAPTFFKEHPSFSGTVIDTVMNLRNTQDTIKIRDGNGALVSEAFWVSTMGAAGNGRSLEFAKGIWREGLREGGSPGLENSIENVVLPEVPSPPPIPSSSPSAFPGSSSLPALTTVSTTTPVVVSEFFPNPSGSDLTGEWIELKNESNASIDLNGLLLGTASSKKTYRMTGKLNPKAFVLVSRSQSQLSLRNTGDTVFLKNAAGALLFQVSYQNEIQGGWAAARFGNTWKLTKRPTPGAPNILEDAGNKEFSIGERQEERARSGEPPLSRESRSRIPWILGIGLLLGSAAAILAILLKRRVLL